MKANSDYCDLDTECISGVCYANRCDIYVDDFNEDLLIDTIIMVVAIVIIVIALVLTICTRR